MSNRAGDRRPNNLEIIFVDWLDAIRRSDIDRK